MAKSSDDGVLKWFRGTVWPQCRTDQLRAVCRKVFQTL